MSQHVVVSSVHPDGKRVVIGKLHLNDRHQLIAVGGGHSLLSSRRAAAYDKPAEKLAALADWSNGYVATSPVRLGDGPDIADPTAALGGTDDGSALEATAAGRLREHQHTRGAQDVHREHLAPEKQIAAQRTRLQNPDSGRGGPAQPERPEGESEQS